MYSRVVSVLSNSGTGTQDITFSGGTSFTPKVAIVQYSRAAVTNGNFNEGVSLGYGFTDGTNSRCVAYVSEDATTSSDTARIQSNNSLISALNQTGTITTVDAVATFTQWLTDGMQITWSNAPTAQFYITVTFLGGDDLTNAQVGTLQTGTGASCSVTGMSWQPDFGMFLYTLLTTHNAGSSSTPSISIGAAKDSSNQWNQTWYHADAALTSSARVSYSHSRVVVQHTTSLSAYSTFSSWNSDGFTLNNTDTYSADHPIYYLVTKGGEIKVGNATEPAGTGTQTITTNTDVKSVIIVGADIGSADTITASGMWSTGMGTSAAASGGLVVDELPASDPMANATLFSLNNYIYHNITANATATSSTIDDLAYLSSCSGTGFVLNWTNIGQARPYRYITFGGYVPQLYPVSINETSVSVGAGSVAGTRLANIHLVHCFEFPETTSELLTGIIPSIQLYPVAISETSVSVSEALGRIQSLIKTIPESAVSISASPVRLPTYLKTVSETAVSVPTEQLVRLQSLIKAVSEGAISIGAGSLSRLLTAIKTISDAPAITTSEQLLRVQTIVKAVSEGAISVSEQLTKTSLYLKPISETAVIVPNESIARWISISYAIAEPSVSVSELLEGALFYLRTVTEGTVNVSESIARLQTSLKTISEGSISSSESLARVQTLLKSISETPIDTTGSPTRIPTWVKSITNEPSVNIDQLVARILAATRTVADTPTISISEQIARTQSLIKSISETPLSTDDSMARAVTFVTALVEARIKWYYSTFTRKISS